MAYLKDHDELDSLARMEVDPIPWEWIGAAHTWSHVEAVRRLSEDRKRRISVDTYLTPAAPEVARLAASGGVAATRAVLNDRVENAFSLMRPPGHHALSTRAMGYCIFNNIAIAAHYALREHGLERILILDIDAHHGNGTEEVFYGSRNVLFVSFHQHPWFPGTGEWHRNGTEAGVGYNYNVALPQWSGDAAYAEVLDRLIVPVVEKYRPQLILVSAGFDAHWADQSSVLGLSVNGYFDLIAGLKTLAKECCGGRIVLFLEGGYNMPSFAPCCAAALRALSGRDRPVDPLGPAPDEAVAPVDGILAHLLGFLDMIAPPGLHDFFEEDVLVPYAIRGT